MSIDTDGILDRCSECGARARFKERNIGFPYGVECSECANAVDYHQTKERAMIVWNQTQRHAIKGKK